MKSFLLSFAIVLGLAAPSAAQQVSLQIEGGLVTLDANAAPARAILAEWGKVGGTKVVGAEKITGAPLTLKLVDVPERQALDIILRNVAGFMAANRAPAAAPGASVYDRILILPTSAAPAATAASNSRGNGPAPGMVNQRRVPPRPPNLPVPSPDIVADDPQDEVQPDTSDTGVEPPVFTFPGPPGQQPVQTPVFVPVPNNGQAGSVTAPVITLQPNGTGQPTVYQFVPTPTTPAAPTTPFGVAGAPTPGMIQQPAQPTQPAGTRPPPR